MAANLYMKSAFLVKNASSMMLEYSCKQSWFLTTDRQYHKRGKTTPKLAASIVAVPVNEHGLKAHAQTHCGTSKHINNMTKANTQTNSTKVHVTSTSSAPSSLHFNIKLSMFYAKCMNANVAFKCGWHLLGNLTLSYLFQVHCASLSYEPIDNMHLRTCMQHQRGLSLMVTYPKSENTVHIIGSPPKIHMRNG
jgi:hypothetical protein